MNRIASLKVMNYTGVALQSKTLCYQELAGVQGVYSGSASSLVPWNRRCIPGDYLQVLL